MSETISRPGSEQQSILWSALPGRPGFHARLLDEVEEAVIATDLTGCVLYWNQRLGKAVWRGYTSRAALGPRTMCGEQSHNFPKIRSGTNSTTPGTKISSIVTTLTAIRNGVDSRVYSPIGQRKI